MKDQNPSAQWPIEALRAYLLGTMAPEEAERLEERLLADEEVYRQVLAVQDELLDEMAQGTLAGNERARLEEELRRQPELAARWRMRQAFFAALCARPRERARWHRWRAPLAAAAAVVAMVIVLTAPRHSSQMFFPALIVRGAPAAVQLRLQPPRPMELQFETPGAGSWNLTLAGSNGFLLQIHNLRAHQTGSVSYVSVWLDTATLVPGAYSARLSAPKDAVTLQRWDWMAQ